MPDVTQIKVKEIIYDIKDAIARLRSIPSGGTAGQFLKKNSNTSYDASWADITIPEYTDATSTSSGLMSANDKIKLDGFSTASNYYTKSQIDFSLSTKANLASPAFTGTPTAPTATDGTNNTQIATTQFVHNAFKANDAMVFKGTIGSSGATVSSLPATHYQGWTYKVITTSTYAGQICEIGDMIICVTDGTSASDAHWTVVQSNVDGAVIGPSSATDTHVAIFNGTSGKIIKDSGFTIGKSVPSNAVFTDTTYTNGNGVVLSGTTFSANFPSSGTPAALGTASNGSANTVARSDHVHAKPSYGNINTNGAITSTTTIANGDKIVIVDSSDSSKLTGTSITFDGSTATKALTQKGTWETFNNYSLPTASADTKGGIKIGSNLSMNGEVLSASDTKVTNTLDNTTKYYITGTSNNSTNTGTQIFDSGIYSTTTSGQLNATTYKVNEQVTLQWNSTDQSLDFVFA